jgi:chitinase
VSPQFDVVNAAFGVPGGGSSSRIVFSPGVESAADFISDVGILHNQGQVVLLSIGGANSPVRLNTSTDVDNFVNSVSGIVNTYGFDGIDIDFENGSLTLNAGDTDINNPTSPTVVNLISALHQLSDQFGPGFVITMAPETFGVQFAFAAYGGERGGTRGAYVPVINLTRNILTYVHVQDYNTGSVTALDFRDYNQGSADFHVAMTDMLLQGFPIAGGRFGRFERLDPTQVAFGVPAGPLAGQGYTAPADLMNSLEYIIHGISFGGQYRLTDTYPTMLGLMTWSVNWDRYYGFQLSNTIGPYLHSL